MKKYRVKSKQEIIRILKEDGFVLSSLGDYEHPDRWGWPKHMFDLCGRAIDMLGETWEYPCASGVRIYASFGIGWDLDMSWVEEIKEEKPFRGIDGAWDNEPGIEEFTKPPFTPREVNAETTPFHPRGLPESEYTFLDGTLMSNYEYVKAILLNSIRTSDTCSPFLSGAKVLTKEDAITEMKFNSSTTKGSLEYTRNSVDIRTENIIKTACMYIKKDEENGALVNSLKLHIDNNTHLNSSMEEALDGRFSVTGRMNVAEYLALGKYELCINLQLNNNKKIKLKLPKIKVYTTEADENGTYDCDFQALQDYDKKCTISMELPNEPIEEEIPDPTKELKDLMKSDWTKKHYDFKYKLTPEDIEKGRSFWIHGLLLANGNYLRRIKALVCCSIT